MTKKSTESIEVPKKDKVYIVGFAPSWVETPWDDQTAEIWTLNEAYKLAEREPKFRADRWFEIHDRFSPSKNTDEHNAFLAQCPCPVYMWQHYDDIPSSVRFPHTEIMEFFAERGSSGSGYFTNSISWFVAYAIYEGFKEIHLYGVDMAQDTEYQAQRPSVEYWIGLAEGMGIKFYVPQTSDILKCTQLYGFESNNKNRAWIKKQVEELKKRGTAAKQQELQHSNAAEQFKIQQAEIRGATSAYMEVLKRTQ